MKKIPFWLLCCVLLAMALIIASQSDILALSYLTAEEKQSVADFRVSIAGLNHGDFVETKNGEMLRVVENKIGRLTVYGKDGKLQRFSTANIRMIIATWQQVKRLIKKVDPEWEKISDDFGIRRA